MRAVTSSPSSGVFIISLGRTVSHRDKTAEWYGATTCHLKSNILVFGCCCVVFCRTTSCFCSAFFQQRTAPPKSVRDSFSHIGSVFLCAQFFQLPPELLWTPTLIFQASTNDTIYSLPSIGRIKFFSMDYVLSSHILGGPVSVFVARTDETRLLETRQ